MHETPFGHSFSNHEGEGSKFCAYPVYCPNPALELALEGHFFTVYSSGQTGVSFGCIKYNSGFIINSTNHIPRQCQVGPSNRLLEGQSGLHTKWHPCLALR